MFTWSPLSETIHCLYMILLHIASCSFIIYSSMFSYWLMYWFMKVIVLLCPYYHLSKVILFSIVSFMVVVVVDIRLDHSHLWVLSSQLTVFVSLWPSSGYHLLSSSLSSSHTHTAAHGLTPTLSSSWLVCQELYKMAATLTVLSPCVYSALSYLVTVVLSKKYYCLHISLHSITLYHCYNQCSACTCTLYVAIKFDKIIHSNRLIVCIVLVHGEP